MADHDGYDLTISRTQDWNKLLQEQLNVIVDPAIYRVGQIFLEGKSRVGADENTRWQAVVNDLGGLINFFELIVLHDRLPAFNYTATFERDLNFQDQLGKLVNQYDKILLNVDVKFDAYTEAKQAALEQMANRMSNGRLASDVTTNNILAALREIEYQWEPNLMTQQTNLEDELRESQDQIRVGHFLLGVLLFGGYAQQSGAPHTLSPRRSKLMAEVGLGVENLTQTAEDELYRELGRRFRDSGEGWRNEELPWTPTFVPWMLTRIDEYRQGPDELIREAIKLRNSAAIMEYRELRADLLTPENDEKQQEACKKLEAAAQGVAKHLGTDWRELGRTRHWLVGVFPKAFGAAAGAVLGGVLAGPVGAGVGGLAGVVGEEAIKPVNEKLWGWVVDRLPYRSASKLLTSSILADYNTRSMLARKLYNVWES